MRKRYFYLGALLLVLFEAANVYFIMPFPGSQRMQSVDVAYFLYRWRWAFRAVFAAIMLAGMLPAFGVRSWRKMFPALTLAVTAAVAFMINTKMQADQIFIAPERVMMKPAAKSVVDSARLVVGVALNGDARAYPLQFIGYHHQVRDSISGAPILVSYCTVCRTGRVFSPTVDGDVDEFRLVGMDHFNAMFEDRKTKSWWRQVNGEAATGAAKGKRLTEIASVQLPLSQWLAMYPNSLIMQPDSALAHRYPTSYAYETGESRSALTGTDTVSWEEKAWVVGVSIAGESRAYDWNRLKRERVVNDVVGGTPIVLALARDSASFFVHARPDSATRFALRNDSLVSGHHVFAVTGRGKGGALRAVPASQEFWHSWRTFNPGTTRY
ncbi:MAG TPA: DUF3179 domain-containing (seleno)protein [Gemmatimonadaceae bacterium]|nr:DUF3179 domain-containing (seleno)protein [Gemmatimonadaceae bacterium]